MKYVEEFPIYNTKVEGVSSAFDLNSINGRKEYFEVKAGIKIGKIKSYLKNNTFIAFLLAKKSAGKGTYTKLMMEIFGEENIGHISVGDVIRSAYLEIQDALKREELKKYMEDNYRGYISVEDALKALAGKDQKTLLPTEFTLALVKREIKKSEPKVLFIDGFPRGSDQIPYTLFFKDLIDLRDDPDFFITIDTPESVIEARMKSRVICPKCKNPRNIRLLPTEFVGFSEEDNDFYLMCDDGVCEKERMVRKEGDSAGLESIRERLNRDGQLMDKIHSLHGISNIHLRSSLLQENALDYADEYELTKEYFYTKEEDGLIKINTKFFSAKGDNEEKIFSLIAPAVVLQLIDQLYNKLEL